MNYDVNPPANPPTLTAEEIAYIEARIKAAEAEAVEQHTQEIKQVRLESCGDYFVGTCPITGGRLSYQVKCGDYRNCPDCREDKAAIIVNRLISGAVDADTDYIYLGEFSNDKWGSTRRKWTRHDTDYWRIPLKEPVLTPEGLTGLSKDCSLIAFCDDGCEMDADGSTIGMPLAEIRTAIIAGTDMTIYDLILAALQKVPEGRRMSGKLGRPPQREQTETDSISIEVVGHDGDKYTSFEAWKVAVQTTSYLNPHTPQEAQAACYIRTTAFKKALKELGASVTSTFWIRRNVPIASIAWSTVDIRPKRTLLLPLDRQSLGWYKSKVPIGMFPAVETFKIPQ